MQGNFKYPRIKKIHSMLEKITRIDPTKVKIFSVLLYHMNCCLQKYTTYQFFIFYILLFISRQVQKSKYFIKIQQVHQKIHTKQFSLFYLNCFLFVIHMNLKQLEKPD